MSGRGATSRKAIKKNIEKTERKKEAKDFADDLSRPPSESGWNLPIRGTSHRRGSFTGASVSTHSSDRSKGSDKLRAATPALFGVEPKDKKYAAKGKETVAPRGRGGGVPPKTAQSAAETLHSNTSYESDPTSPKGAPPQMSAREKGWANMRVWHGHGQPTQRWRGFERDSDMYMPSGDCLVYFSEENSQNEPRPMLRVHVEKLQEARSAFLSNLVTYGEIDQEDYSPPPSVTGSASSPPAYPLTSSNLGYLDGNTVSSPRDTPDRGMMSPTRQLASQSVRSSESAFGANLLSRNPHLSAFPTPPRSRTQSDVTSSADLSNQEAEVTHEIWFPAPSYIKTPHAQRRHHLATRNFLALLYNKPIVGTDLFEMLSELQMVMDIMYELNEPSRRPNVAAIIVDYVVGRNLDDVRGSLTNALSLLAWTEKLDVGWDQGYLESFVHAVGMLTRGSFERPEYKRLSPVTRHNLEKAYNGMQIKILNAEEKLSTFAFPDLWHLPNVVANSPAFRSSEAFRGWLKRYFAHKYEQWPPKPNRHGHWVTRGLIQKLQGDFGAIYDVLVNRDIIWTDNEARHTRKWEMASKTALTDIFSPDLPGMPITDMLISFDNQHGYLHIPHPYPLLPRRVSSLTAAPSKKKNIFGLGKKDKAAAARDPSEQMKISLAFGDATNINKLGMMLEANDLRDEFLEYEKSAAAGELRDVPAADARLGRWLLLYGILQVLSTLSVDTEGLKYKVPATTTAAATTMNAAAERPPPPPSSYFISPSLDNCPPWAPARSLTGTRRVPSTLAVREASQRQSHCWLAPLRWDGGGGGGGGAANDGAAAAAAAAAELETTTTTTTDNDDDNNNNTSHSRGNGSSGGGGGGGGGAESGRISELDGRLLDDRDRKLRMHQFEQKLLAQRREFEAYELRYGGLRERVMGGQQQYNNFNFNDDGRGEQQQQQQQVGFPPPPLRSRSGSNNRHRGSGGGGGGEKEYGPGGGGGRGGGGGGGGETRGRSASALGHGVGGPDVPLRSPLRSPPPPGSRGAGARGGGGGEKEMLPRRRLMEYYVDDDDGLVEAEGEREGEFLPGYAR